MKSQNACTIDVNLNASKKEATVIGTDIYFGSDEWSFLMKHNGYFSVYWMENVINFGTTTTGLYAYYKGKKKYVTRFLKDLTIDRLIEIARELVR